MDVLRIPGTEMRQNQGPVNRGFEGRGQVGVRCYLSLLGYGNAFPVAIIVGENRCRSSFLGRRQSVVILQINYNVDL